MDSDHTEGSHQDDEEEKEKEYVYREVEVLSESEDDSEEDSEEKVVRGTQIDLKKAKAKNLQGYMDNEESDSSSDEEIVLRKTG